MEKLLHNKATIITGAANGVGQIISQKFAEEGADLILADMDEENLKKEAELLRKDGSNVEIFCGDLRKNLTIKKRFDVDNNPGTYRQTRALGPQRSSIEQGRDQNMQSEIRFQASYSQTSRRFKLSVHTVCS